MGKKNYIKIQNQGNIYQNLILLNEMANSVGYADENGYFSKKAIAEIAINAYLLTSEGKMGEDILDKVSDTELNEGLNKVLQNAKQRMQILRVLGLISSDYSSELYAITDLGYKVLERVFPSSQTILPDYSLLRETLMGITSSTEIYEYNIDFNSYLGFEICYAFSHLNYKISTYEMPIITTYSIEDIKDFIKTVKEYRSLGMRIPNTHEHYPKTYQGKPLEQVSNLTRTINQILRICGIIEKREVKIGTENYYVCTDYGKKYVDNVRKLMENKSFKLWTAHLFRKQNLLKQKEICIIGYNNMLEKGGYDVEITDRNLVFSPYQLLPEINVDWLLGKDIRKPPEVITAKINVINSQITGKQLRLKPSFYSQEDYDEFIKTHITKTNLIEEILSERRKGTTKDELINTLCERYKMADKSSFYPFVHSLFMAMGLNSYGEVGRIDGLLEYNSVKIPCEIKSFTETKAYNLKGARQALENKIITYKEPEDIKYASLLIGYLRPTSLIEIQEFIDAAFFELGIKIIAFDLRTIVKMCVNTIWDKQKVDFDKLLKEYGIAEA